MAIELATAYVSLVPETTKLEAGIKSAFSNVGKQAETAGADMGKRLAQTASKALKDGWRPDQDIMAGIPNTKLDRIGAHIGQVIGKGIVGGIKARQLGRDFGSSFAQGAGSIGLGSVISGWHSDLAGRFNKLGFVAGKALSAGMTAAVGAGIAGVGLALTKGFDRLVALDTAQYKLKQILRASGRDVREADKISQAIQKSVDKTPFSLDQAFGTAVQAIGAGAQDIERFMTDVADAAGFAGTDLERMGLIFNQVLAKGKLTGEETMQLMEAGLPARSWIQDSYKLTAQQFDDMQKNGQISLDMLQKSIEDHAPGMAKALGNTLQGSIDNMQTAIGRVGANFLSAMFGGPTGDATEGLKSAVERITTMLNNLNSWIIAHKEDIKEFFNNAKEAAKDLFGVIGDIANALREHPGLIQAAVIAFAAFETIKGIATVATGLAAVNSALTIMPGLATSALGPVGLLVTSLTALAALRSQLEWGNGDPVSAIPNASDFDPGKRSTAEIMLGPIIGPALDRSLGYNQPSIPGGGGPGAQRERRGLTPTGGGTGKFPQGLPQGTRTAGLPFAAPANMGGNKAAVYRAMLDAGFSPDSFAKLDYIIMHESQYNTTAKNPATGDWGIPQFNPAVGNIQRYLGGYNTDPYAQGSGMMRYIKERYGSIEAAYAFKVANGWYASGGAISGAGTGKSDSIPAWLSNGEHVLSAADVAAMGGQGAVYAFRNALHRDDGGPVLPLEDEPGWNPDTMGNKRRGPLEDEPGWNPDTMGNRRRGPLEDQPGWDWRTMGNQRRGHDYVLMGGNHIKGYADGGAIDPNLQQLVDQGVDPNTLTHGSGNGAAPGPTQTTNPQDPNYGMDFVRSLGFIPASAGNTGVAGTSSVAQFINMGNQVVGGIIDTGANLAQTAAAAAIAAGSMGSSAAAGPAASIAASYGIQLGANELKRVSSYWFQMAGIGADALIEQLFPFGAPRWAGYDYTSFAPQLGIQQAFTSTVEKMGTDAINKAFPKPGEAPQPSPAGPVNPATMPGMPQTAPPPTDQANLAPSGPAAPTAPTVATDALIPNLFAYDRGGMLAPGQLGVNLTNRPEPVLTPQQWEAIAAGSSTPNHTAPLVNNLYAQDMQDAIRQLEKVKRRDMMQYAGRP